MENVPRWAAWLEDRRKVSTLRYDVALFPVISRKRVRVLAGRFVPSSGSGAALLLGADVTSGLTVAMHWTGAIAK